MRRREFTALTLRAVALSTTGIIYFNGRSYDGDCETTNDILGPFYRPGSPVRNNLVIEGSGGEIVELSGTVRHNDCRTPYANAKVELWHCSADETYDNDSEEFRYRGTTFCDENGKYRFTTQMPVPYKDPDNNIRPAHFHLMISAPHYQNFITQIYFEGDPHLKADVAASSKKAQKRILRVKSEGGKKIVVFDVNLLQRPKSLYSSLEKITGAYRNDQNDKVLELFQADNLLWLKNNVYGVAYEYINDNKFEYPGLVPGRSVMLDFDLTAVPLKLTMTITRPDNVIVRKFTKV